jgi:putative transposase
LQNDSLRLAHDAYVSNKKRNGAVRLVVYRVNMLRRTFKFRLYPTPRQERLLLAQMEFVRELYNAALEQRIVGYQRDRRSISYLEQSRELTELRRDCADLFPLGMSRSTQQFALRRLDHAFRVFFRRAKNGQKAGFPRFKSANRWNTLQAQYGYGTALRENLQRLHWIGVGNIKVRLHRPIPEHADLKAVTLKKLHRQWYACIELTLPTPRPLPPTNQPVGVDLGITNFAALSTGELVAGPRAQRHAELRVAQLQRRIVGKREGSKRRREALELLARARRKEARVRRDHHFKVAHSLVRRFDVICLEDLNIQTLANSTLAKDVRDQAWGQFVNILGDKAEEAGRLLVFVNPKNTTQMCSNCTQIVPKGRGERIHSCSCGLVLDRDVNAARNILRLGASQQSTDAAEFHPRRIGIAHLGNRQTSPDRREASPA